MLHRNTFNRIFLENIHSHVCRKGHIKKLIFFTRRLRNSVKFLPRFLIILDISSSEFLQYIFFVYSLELSRVINILDVLLDAGLNHTSCSLMLHRTTFNRIFLENIHSRVCRKGLLLSLQYLSVISFHPTVFVFVCGINCGLD